MTSYRLFAFIFALALPLALATIVLSSLHQPFLASISFWASTCLGLLLVAINFVNIIRALRRPLSQGRPQ
jgi:hypothetical protein